MPSGAARREEEGSFFSFKGGGPFQIPQLSSGNDELSFAERKKEERETYHNKDCSLREGDEGTHISLSARGGEKREVAPGLPSGKKKKRFLHRTDGGMRILVGVGEREGGKRG